ncbi:hypothetical protein GCM10022225_77260 [Plantactinospora mayteni]
MPVSMMLTFNTAHGSITGAREARSGMVSNAADFVFIEGDAVALVRGSGLRANEVVSSAVDGKESLAGGA